MSEHIAHRVEHDFTPMVDKIAAQIQHKVDQAALDKAAYMLEQFGYVKVVRCRDCKHYYEAENYHPSGNYVSRCCKYFDTYNDEVEPDGFCKWAGRRDA